jgi:hypothetical protein
VHSGSAGCDDIVLDVVLVHVLAMVVVGQLTDMTGLPYWPESGSEPVQGGLGR